MKTQKELDILLEKIRKMLEIAEVDHFIVAIGMERENDTFDVCSDGYFSREFITTLAHNLIADLVRNENEVYDDINNEEDKPVLN